MGMAPRDWAPSTSSQGCLGCELSWAATAAIGITWPVFQSRCESTTNRVAGLSWRSNRCSTCSFVSSAVPRRSATGKVVSTSPWRWASSRQAATTPGCSQSLIRSSSPRCQGRPQSGSTQPLVTFSLKASRCAGTPNQLARCWRSWLVVCSTKGHTAPVNGPSSWMVRQAAVMASRDELGRGPWPP